MTSFFAAHAAHVRCAEKPSFGVVFLWLDKVILLVLCWYNLNYQLTNMQIAIHYQQEDLVDYFDDSEAEEVLALLDDMQAIAKNIYVEFIED